MVPEKDWNPDLYLKFGNERTQPSIDLINRINISFKPKSVLDIGCGPGNSSQALLQRWPEARLTGIDNSMNMIEKARANYPNNVWILADASNFTSKTKFDVVFSSATIQWIADHERLFKKFYTLIKIKGVLAVQVPLFHEMPLSKAIQKVAGNKRWREPTKNCWGIFTFHDAEYYYDLMYKKYKKVEIWQTDYVHVMESHQAIIEWIRSTGMKPYLDSLKETEKPRFEKEVLAEIKRDYSIHGGKVLFPFRRLFLIGYK